jgi:hypothetical protein
MYNDLHRHIPGSDQGASLFAGKCKTYSLLSVFTRGIFKFTTTTTTDCRVEWIDRLFLQSVLYPSVLPSIIFNLAALFRSPLNFLFGLLGMLSETLSYLLIINHQMEGQSKHLTSVSA